MFRTMLVEDNPSFRRILKDNLQDLFPSMEIIEASEGAEALQKIDFRPPDLIFMDVRLPGENGLELTGRIKADHPEIIVVILTSYDSQEYREAAIRFKADYFFSKDAIANNEIFAVVNSLMLKKRFRSEGPK
jgi:DNA-binding NarL/FixJ family response regulator